MLHWTRPKGHRSSGVGARGTLVCGLIVHLGRRSEPTGYLVSTVDWKFVHLVTVPAPASYRSLRRMYTLPRISIVCVREASDCDVPAHLFLVRELLEAAVICVPPGHRD